MLIVLKRVCIMLVFMAIGYGLQKRKRLPPYAASVLSKLCVMIFLPAMMFRTFATQFNLQNIREKSVYFGVSAVALVFIAVGSRFLAKAFSKDHYERGIYQYTFTVPNCGYMGYALMSAIYGQDMLLNLMIYVLPISLFTYSEGYRLLTDTTGVSPKKFLNPVLVSIVLGCVVGLLPFSLPGLATDILTDASGCMAPVGMILTGIAIADFPLRELLNKWQVYAISAIRLLGIPLLMVGIFRLLHLSDTVILIAIMCYGMPCGMNTIIFPQLKGRDCRIGAGLVLLSNIAAVLTIPLLLHLFGVA